MRYSIPTYLAWILFDLALVLWAAVGYLAWAVAVGESERVTTSVSVAEETRRQEVNLRLHTLVRETSAERAELEDIAHVGGLEIIDAIEAAGEDIGVSMKIGQALSTLTEQQGPELHSALLVVDASGSFAKMVQAASLLELLPVPSSVVGLRFEHIPSPDGGSSQGPWRMVARIQFLTTADISS